MVDPYPTQPPPFSNSIKTKIIIDRWKRRNISAHADGTQTFCLPNIFFYQNFFLTQRKTDITFHIAIISLDLCLINGPILVACPWYWTFCFFAFLAIACSFWFGCWVDRFSDHFGVVLCQFSAHVWKTSVTNFYSITV